MKPSSPDKIEESLTLDYKHGAALARDDRKRDEITKNVSAFAYSAGGLLIYGIAEGVTPETKHLPAGFAPVDHALFSKETLEQVIQWIQRRIEGIEIIPVALSSGTNQSAYVVHVPQSDTAHRLTRLIADNEAELNDRVYRLFDLTADEIALLQKEVEH